MTEGGVSPVPRGARAYQGRRAGLVTRFVASGIDALVVIAAVLVGYFAFAGILFLLSPPTFSLPEASPFLSMGSTLALLVVYLTATWAISGRTYGGLVMGLRVVDHRGRNPRVPLALARAVACAVFPIGLLWCAFSRGNRSLQDLLLRTYVVYDWQPRDHGGPSHQTRSPTR